MSRSIYLKAKKYYPDKWNRAMVDNLHNTGKLTDEEYNDIIGESEDEASESN